MIQQGIPMVDKGAFGQSSVLQRLEDAQKDRNYSPLNIVRALPEVFEPSPRLGLTVTLS